MEKKQLDPISVWLGEAIAYTKNNATMILKVVGYGMLNYLGIMVLIIVIGGIGAGIVGALGLVSNPISILLAVLASIAAFVGIFAMAGKVIILELAAAKAPVLNIRETWKAISYKDGLAMYWVLFVTILAIYTGMLFLIIPGIILSTWVSLAIYMKSEQGVGGVSALMLSRDYTKGYGWSILGRWALSFAAMFVIMFVALLAYTWMAKVNALLGIIGYVLYMLLTLLSGFINFRLGYQMYQNLVAIKGRLELNASSGRKFRWNMLAYGLVILAVFGILAAGVLAAVNPAAQIEKANQIKQQQEQSMGVVNE